MQYTIEEAQKSSLITKLMMTSEDQAINGFARSLGVQVDYIRPQELAEDNSTTVSAVLHVLDWLEDNQQLPDIVVLLQPTSPLRTTKEIDKAIAQFLASTKDSLLSVQKMKEHPFKCIKKTTAGWDYLAKPKQKVSRRQDYAEGYYVINGAIYVVSTQYLREKASFTSDGDSELFVMDAVSGVDIDDLTDIFQAESILKARK